VFVLAYIIEESRAKNRGFKLELNKTNKNNGDNKKQRGNGGNTWVIEYGTKR
jgi:hypothetical protein